MSDQLNTRQERRQAQKKKENNKGTSKKKLFKKIAIITGIAALVAMIAGGISVFAIISGSPELDEEKLVLTQGALIYDQNDEFLSQLETSERRMNVSINDVPEVVQDAFIAVEDIRFREHFGIDIRRLFGAVAANITDGFGAEGASTITQQLVKNLFLEHDKKMTRKIQEQYLAIKLEQQYSKDQILEMYLNQIYLGSGVYGIELASQRYFNKSVDELSLEDAALLAGIPRRPSFYDPTVNPEAAESRRNLVLSLMEQHGKITAEEAEAASSIPIEEQLDVTERESYPYEAFFNLVLSELEEIEGITSSDIYNSGIKVYTTLDTSAQEHVEAVLQTDQFIQNYPSNEDFQAAITLLDTETGQIKAVGSGREDTGVQRGFNYATEAKRQIGSTAKPLLDYGPAIEYLQWSTGRIIVDEAHSYSTGDSISNFDGAYKGPMSMRRALAESRNVPAVKALQEVGTDRAKEFGEQLGLEIETMHESYGLGAIALSTKEVAGAFAAFGNNGTYTEPYSVRKIEFPDGRVLELEPDSHMAMSDYTAYMITDMLKTAVTNGTGGTANISGLPMAGKTGTTNFDEDTRNEHNIPSNAAPDIWFAGYTTKYTAAVWTGFDKHGPENYFPRQDPSRQIAQQIFKAVMEQVSANIETPDFTMPNSVVRVGVERSTGLLPSDFTPSSEIIYELFVRGNEPTRVSEEFFEIEAPKNLMANYEESSNQILMSWDYPEQFKDQVTFEIQVSVDGGERQTLDRKKDMQYIYGSPEEGSTYEFYVTAISDEHSNLRSDSASVKVTIPEAEVEDPDDDVNEPDEEPVEDPTDIPDPIDGIGDGDGNEPDQGEEPNDPNDTNEPIEEPTTPPANDNHDANDEPEDEETE